MKQVGGFTLLELLIGLVLLGFIMSLLFGGFRLATKSWDAVEAHAAQTADENAALALMRRIFSSAQPLRLKQAQGKPLAFVGHADRLSMVVSLTQATGPRTVDLFFERQAETASGDLSRLILQNGPPPYGDNRRSHPMTDSPQRILFDSLRDAEFSYFGSSPNNSLSQWHDSWDNPQQLPLLIRMRLNRTNGDSIELVSALMVTTPYSPTTGRLGVGAPE